MIEVVNLCRQPTPAEATPAEATTFAQDIKNMDNNPGQVFRIAETTYWELIESLPPMYSDGMIGLGEPNATVRDLDGKYRESTYWMIDFKLDAFERCQAGLEAELKPGIEPPFCFGVLAAPKQARKAFNDSPICDWHKWPGYDEKRPIKQSLLRRIKEAHDAGETLSLDYLVIAMLDLDLADKFLLIDPSMFCESNTTNVVESKITGWILENGASNASK